METNNDMQQELTPEELALKKNEMLTFYTDSMPYLKAQLEYEKILADIDEVRFKRFSISMQSAMMMQEPSEEGQNNHHENTSENIPEITKKKKPLRTT